MPSHHLRPQSGAATLHPVLWVAAIAITAFSILGIGNQLGWLKTAEQQTAATILVPSETLAAATEAAPAAKADKPVKAEQPAAKTATPAEAKPVQNAPAPAKSAPPKQASQTPPPSKINTQPAMDSKSTQPARQVCADCGVISSVRAVEVEGKGTGAGVVVGGVLGGVVGNQFGKGSGKTAATVLGAVVGGVSGHKIEENVRTSIRYDITIRMDDGSTRMINREQAPSLGEGTRVRVNGDQITELSSPGSSSL